MIWLSKKLSACLLVGLQLFDAQAVAGDVSTTPAARPVIAASERALEQVREELTDLERHWYGITRFRFSYPQKFSAGFGAIFVQQPKDTDCSTGCMVHGWQFEVEPGERGIQGSVGWGKLAGETGRTKRLMHNVYYAWAVRGVVMRTWGDYPKTRLAKTLLGVEGSVSIVRLNFSLGLLRSLSSNAPEDWVVSAGAGFGF
jgi:hypothetical protein